jgi:hypothetical protein
MKKSSTSMRKVRFSPISQIEQFFPGVTVPCRRGSPVVGPRHKEDHRQGGIGWLMRREGGSTTTEGVGKEIPDMEGQNTIVV